MARLMAPPPPAFADWRARNDVTRKTGVTANEHQLKLHKTMVLMNYAAFLLTILRHTNRVLRERRLAANANDAAHALKVPIPSTHVLLDAEANSLFARIMVG